MSVCSVAPPVVDVPQTGNWGKFWLFRLMVNLFCYASIALPAYFAIKTLKKSAYLKTGRGKLATFARVMVIGNSSTEIQAPSDNSPSFFSNWNSGVLLLCCAIGLQVAFLTWGVIQERIMTQKYGAVMGKGGENFTNSQFLVFVNRFLAFLVAGVVITTGKQPNLTCPLYKFSYASFSNIMSSWFQYEALKFISFPTQVLGKACKVIPVMLMGKIVSGNKYQMYEWMTAGLLSVGISFFLLGQQSDHSAAPTTGENVYGEGIVVFSGFVLMLGYMAFDSFTSNWQGELFKVYKMSSTQMMFGVNLFSCLFTFVSLLEQGGFLEAAHFMFKHYDFAIHVLVLSVCAAMGQLFIYFTISRFGAVAFTIIMTLRQAFAILLSCIIYSHPVTSTGMVGILVVFLALVIRIYAKSRISKMKQAKSADREKLLQK